MPTLVIVDGLIPENFSPTDQFIVRPENLGRQEIGRLVGLGRAAGSGPLPRFVQVAADAARENAEEIRLVFFAGEQNAEQAADESLIEVVREQAQGFEILEAMQRRTVDAIQTSRGWGMGFGLPDVSTHVSIWRVQSIFPGMLIVNKKAFDALPADLQKILIDTGREMQGQTTYGAKIEEYESEIGVKVSPLKLVKPDKKEVDKARQLVKPVIQKWLDRAGPHGKEVLSIAAEYASGAKVMMAK
jgi:hypothetical protein